MNELIKYFPELNKNKINLFLLLEKLYKKYNQQINIISRKDINNLPVHHFLPALAIAKVAKFKDGSNVLDIGTGGGLPGLALAIYYDNISFTLIDSIGKKINIVNAIIKDLGLTKVEAKKIRSSELREKFDYVVGRGVTDPIKFMNLAKKNLHNNNTEKSVFYISGGQELLNTINEDKSFSVGTEKLSKQKIAISNFFSEEYFKNKYVYL